MKFGRDIICLSIGNSTCKAAYIIEDTVYDLRNYRNSCIFPSIVTISSGETYVCNDIGLKRFPKSSIRNALRLLGKSYYSREVEEELINSMVPIEMDSNGNVVYHIENIGKEYWTPEDIIEMMVSFLVQECQKNVTEIITRCVLTVPDYFDDISKSNLSKAIERAGIRVENILTDSISSAYYMMSEHRYDDDIDKWDNNYLVVYDLGGHGFYCSVLNILDGVPSIICTTSDQTIGSDMFVSIIVQYVQTQIQTRYDVELFDGVESGQKYMSDHEYVVQSVREGLIFVNEIDEISVMLPRSCVNAIRRKRRKEIEREEDEDEIESIEVDISTINRLLSPVIMKTIQLTKLAIQKATICQEDIFRIIHIGGCSYSKLLYNRLVDTFSECLIAKYTNGFICAVRGGCEYIMRELSYVYY